jgi:hypothetical protein
MLFSEDGYELVPRALPAVACDFLARHLQQLVDQGRLKGGDTQVERAWTGYAIPAVEALLERFQPLVSQRTGHELIPTYSYARVYLPGAELERHTDRPACEVSATLTVASRSEAPWPLFMETCGGKAEGIPMEPGDILIYRGTERPHWRESFHGDWHMQIFLHWVRADGPWADKRFDGRGDVLRAGP